MQLSSKARKAVATGLTASTLLWSAMLSAPLIASAAVHPDGCIVISNGTAWFISGGQRHGFPSNDVFTSYGYNFGQLAQASAEDMALSEGSVKVYADGTLVKGPSDPLVYLVTGGQKRGFTSGSVFLGRGFRFSNAMVAAVNTFADLPLGSNIDDTVSPHSQGVTVINNGTVWLMTGSGRMGYPSMAVFTSHGLSLAKVVPANAADMALPDQGVVQLLTGCSGSNPSPGPAPAGPFNPNGGTQGSIEDVTAGSRNETEALEGQSNVEIAAFDVKLSNDGPLQLQSADVWFANADPTLPKSSSKPWDYFTKVALMVGGQVVQTANASLSTDWSDSSNGNITSSSTTETVTPNEYRMRFTGLSSTLNSDATTKVSVAVSMVQTIDSADESAVWVTDLTALRVLDESRLVLNANQTDFTVSSDTELESSFTVGQKDVAQVDVRDAASPVDASLIQVSQTADTNGVAVYNFTIKEKNGVALTFDDIQMTFTTADPTVVGSKGDLPNNVIKNAYLFEGSTQRGNTESVPSTGVVVFDNTAIAVAANETKTFTVKVDLFDNNDGLRYGEGTTVSVAVNQTNTTFTDVNGNDEQDSPPSVSATSETHELRSQGIRVTMTGTPTSAVTPVDNANNDLFTFQWKFDVTAFGENDVFINKDIADIVQTQDATDVDTVYSIETSASSPLGTPGGTLVVGNNTPSDVTGNTNFTGTYNGEAFFVIPTGTTRSFTLTVNGTNTAAQQARALLQNIEWTADDITAPASGALLVVPSTVNAYTFNLGNKAATPFITAN